MSGCAAKADTELGEEGRLAKVKATASFILDEYLMCESSVDAAHIIEELGAPRCETAPATGLALTAPCGFGAKWHGKRRVHPCDRVDGRYHAALIKRLLTTAMDKSEREQDMAATLVSSLCVRGVVHNRDCEAGLEELLKSMPDLGIARPMPNAPEPDRGQRLGWRVSQECTSAREEWGAEVGERPRRQGVPRS